MKRYQIGLLLFFAMFTLHAQNDFWEKAKSPYGGSVIVTPTHTNIVYAQESYNVPVHRSADYGEHWQSISVTAVDTTGFSAENLFTIGASGNFYKIVGNANFVRKLFISTDEGQSWSLNNNDLPINNLFEMASGVLIGTDLSGQMIFRSSNSGATWQMVYTASGSNIGFTPYNRSTSDGKILLSNGSHNEFVYSEDDGLTWVEGESPFYFSSNFLAASGTIISIDQIGPPIFNLYRSTDKGVTWDTVPFNLGATGYLTGITNLNNGKILLASNTDLFVSEDDGLNWDLLPPSAEQARYFLINAPLPNGDLLASTKGALVRSSDEGNNWSFSAFGMKAATVKALKPINESIRFDVTDAGLWKTTDAGESWNRLLADTSTSSLYSPHPLALMNEDSFAIILGKDIWATVDGGQSFDNLTPSGGLYRGNIFVASGGQMFCTDNSGLLRTAGFGGSWSLAIPNVGIVSFGEHPSGDLYAFTTPHGSSFQGQNLWCSHNLGETWEEINTLVLTLEYRLDFYLDNNGKLYVSGFHNNALQLAISDDGGISWIYKVIPDIYAHANIIVNDIGQIFTVVSSQESTILTSADGGDSWYYLPKYPDYSNNFNDFELSPEGYLYVTRYGIMIRSTKTTEFGAYIRGQLTKDADADCSTPDAQEPLKNWVIALDGESTYYNSTNADGRYTFFVDTGQYTIQTIIPQNLWWSLCDTVQEIVATDFLNADTANFVALPIADCPLMSVNVGIPQLRRCFDNPVFIAYCNQGTEPADSAWVDVMLDPYLSFVGSAQAHEVQTNNTIRFFVGDVPSGECGQFQLTVHVDCDSTVIGQTHCITAHGFPDTLCVPVPTWSGANIEATVACQDTVLQVKLQNTGSAPSQLLDYIIIEDDVVLFSGEKNYAPGESFTMDYPANGNTWRVESAQEPGHPFSYLALAFAEGCGGFGSLGYINQFPINGSQPSWHRMCIENIGSYDPNDKQGFPIGHGAEHNIRLGQKLDYLIRFQNTGTDTAFTVVVRDTLSPLLDPTSFRPGVSSHPYTWDLNGQGVVSFTFSNIALPDSNVSEPNSHGFIQFNITPYADAALGSVIENHAAIYFDFNTPVLTNTTWHTLEKDPLKSATQPIPPTPKLGLEVRPNPFSERVNIHIEQKTNGPIWLQLYNSTGDLVAQKSALGPDIELNTKHLPNGLYWAKLQDKQGRLVGSGKLIKK